MFAQEACRVDQCKLVADQQHYMFKGLVAVVVVVAVAAVAAVAARTGEGGGEVW